MEREAVAFLRRIGHRIAARAAVLHLHSKVLTRLEACTLAKGQAQAQHRDIRCRTLMAVHFHGEGFARVGVDAPPRLRTQHQVRARRADTEQHLAGQAGFVDEACAGRTRHLAGFDLADATAAHALSAGVGHLDARPQRGVEHAAARRAIENHVGRLNADAMARVGGYRPRRHQQSVRCAHSGSAIKVSVTVLSHTATRSDNSKRPPCRTKRSR